MTEDTKKTESKRLPVISKVPNLKPSHVLGKDGPIAKDLTGYQERKAQITLAEKIQEAFAEAKH